MHEIETLSLSASFPVSVSLALALLALAIWRRPFDIVGIDHLALVTRHWPFGIGQLACAIWKTDTGREAERESFYFVHSLFERLVRLLISI